MVSAVTHFEDLGGEPALRAIIDDFVDRLFDDVMIGFMFQRANRARIKRFEYQHAAEHLGADVPYEGRALTEAHASHRIMGGQFDRRKKILENTLRDHAAPDRVIEAWLAHVDTLRPLITGQVRGECD